MAYLSTLKLRRIHCIACVCLTDSLHVKIENLSKKSNQTKSLGISYPSLNYDLRRQPHFNQVIQSQLDQADHTQLALFTLEICFGRQNELIFEHEGSDL